MISPFENFSFSCILLEDTGEARGYSTNSIVIFFNILEILFETLSFLNGLKVETWFLDSILGVKRTSRFFFGLTFPSMVQQLG